MSHRRQMSADEASALEADHVSWTECGCGQCDTVYLWLRDAQHRAIAVAAFPRAPVAQLAPAMARPSSRERLQ